MSFEVIADDVLKCFQGICSILSRKSQQFMLWENRKLLLRSNLEVFLSFVTVADGERA